MTWTGMLSIQQEAVGVTINWAYAPGEFRILTSEDGGNFEQAASWRTSARSEVSYSEAVMFEKPRRVKAVTVVMRSPQSWGYFGINDISLMAQPGASMLVSGELCLVARGSALSADQCLDAIASGSGAEVFGLNGRSQLVAAASGKCVSLASDGQKLLMQDCDAAFEAGDGRSTLSLTPAAQLQFRSFGNYCLAASAAGASAVPCEEADSVVLTAVPDFDPTAVEQVRDSAALLRAATTRQRALLATLQDRLAKAGACSGFIKANASGDEHPLSLEALVRSESRTSLQPELEVSSKIDGLLEIDLSAIKALISESRAVLASAA